MSLNGGRIPLYSAENELRAWIPYKRAEQLAREGVGRLVRHRKGHISRCVLHRRPSEPSETTVQNYTGTKYSFREKHNNTLRCWRLKRLGKGDELRPLFRQVLTDCLTNDAQGAR